MPWTQSHLSYLRNTQCRKSPKAPNPPTRWHKSPRPPRHRRGPCLESVLPRHRCQGPRLESVAQGTLPRPQDPGRSRFGTGSPRHRCQGPRLLGRADARYNFTSFAVSLFGIGRRSLPAWNRTPDAQRPNAPRHLRHLRHLRTTHRTHDARARVCVRARVF